MTLNNLHSLQLLIQMYPLNKLLSYFYLTGTVIFTFIIIF